MEQLLLEIMGERSEKYHLNGQKSFLESALGRTTLFYFQMWLQIILCSNVITLALSLGMTRLPVALSQ